MNRAFKSEFFNDNPDKIIVTMGVRVNNGKLFSNLDEEGRENLIQVIKMFEESVAEFRKELETGFYHKAK